MNKLINATFYAVMISFMGFIDSAELPNFSDLAEKSSPAVVNITSTKLENSRSSSPYDNREFGDPRYDEFFKRFFGEDPRNARKQRPVI